MGCQPRVVNVKVPKVNPNGLRFDSPYHPAQKLLEDLSNECIGDDDNVERHFLVDQNLAHQRG
jgi:hypothetical protein